MENNPDMLDLELFEQTIYNDLNALRGNVDGLVMNNLTDDNNFGKLINSGAKGQPLNLGQMAGAIGQQAVEGKRIAKKVNNRTLPCFYKNDDSAIARGFVEQSFLGGSKPISFIFHNMGSREGLIDTAIKSVTGDTPIIIIENDGI